MLDRVAIEAREIVVGDRLHIPGDVTGRESVPVSAVDDWTDHPDSGLEVVEVFTNEDMTGPPAATYEPGEIVSVWREVSC